MKNKLKKKIRKEIKLHMYDKGVIHFEYLNENVFVEKLVLKYNVDKDSILEQYLKLGYSHTQKNKPHHFFIDIIVNYVADSTNVSSFVSKQNLNTRSYLVMVEVMEMSLLTGKTFNDILLICAKLDVCIVSKLKSEKVYNLDVINEAILNG